MYLFFFALVCFLAQCVFFFADEHLLVLLVFLLVAVFLGLLTELLYANLYSVQVAIVKRIIKTKVASAFFINQVEVAEANLEAVCFDVLMVSVELFEALPDFLVEAFDNAQLLKFQLSVSQLLDDSLVEAAFLVENAKLSLVTATADELSDELSDENSV